MPPYSWFGGGTLARGRGGGGSQFGRGDRQCGNLCNMYFVVHDIEFGIPARLQIQKMAYCPPLEGIFLQKEQRLKGLSQMFCGHFFFFLVSMNRRGLDQLTV